MQQRLIVKNFGPVKEVDITFDKLLVMIGPQGSGKSTVAKLLAIFSKETNNNQLNIENFNQALLAYNIDFEYDNEAYINYQDDEKTISLTNNEITKSRSSGLRTKTNKKSDISSGTEVIYIPAERIMIPMIANASFSFMKSDVAIPEFVLDFGEKFQKARNNTGFWQIDYLNVRYVKNDPADLIYFSENHAIPITKSSSGIQAVVPAIVVLRHFRWNRYKALHAFFCEEPEMNLFPVNQNHFIGDLIDSCQDWEDQLVITTHSPYVLSSINNLLYAHKLGQHLPQQVSQIVKKTRWITASRTGAYKFSDGYAHTIIDEDLQLIKTEEIDEASDQINSIFDQLFELEHNEGLRKVS